MAKIITRQDLIELLEKWSKGELDAENVHSWALSIYFNDNYEKNDWEGDDSVTNEVLGHLDMLDMNFVTTDDIPALIEFLKTPLNPIQQNVLEFLPKQTSVQEAVRRGANKILVLRSRPASYVKKHNLLALIFMKVFHYRQRALHKTFKQRPQAYMNALRFISNPLHGLVIRQLEPPEPMKLERSTVDQAILEEAYRQGLTAGKRFVVEIQTVGF